MDQFYGIEIAEWPARIAEVALWLMDHQMNIRLSEAFGQLYRRLPLKKSPHIHQANALRVDWKEILPPDQCSYVLGNPPFVGKKEQTADQKADMDLVFAGVKGGGRARLRHGWYMQGRRVHPRHAALRSASSPPTQSARASRWAFCGTSSSSAST